MTKSAPSRLTRRTARRASAASATSMVGPTSAAHREGVPSTMGLPITQRGPRSSPLRIFRRHSWWTGSPRISRTVVTPVRAYSAGTTVSGPSLWVCASISPGIRYLPVRSTVRVPGRSRMRVLGATAVMRPPSTTTVMSGAGGAPEPSITVTCVNANGPLPAPTSALAPTARAVPTDAVLTSAVPVTAAAPARNPRRATPRCAPTVASDMLFPLQFAMSSAVAADTHDSGGPAAIGQCGQTVCMGVLLGPPLAVTARP